MGPGATAVPPTTCTFIAGDVAAVLFWSPVYEAVIACSRVPANALDSVARPEATLAEPISLAPSRNVTVPVGLNASNVAVRVVDPPETTTSGAAVTCKTGSFCATSSGSDPALGSLELSPWNSAVSGCVPSDVNAASSTAVPLETFAVPSSCPPFLKTTGPLALPPPTAAVSTRLRPICAGEVLAMSIVAVTFLVTAIGTTLDVLGATAWAPVESVSPLKVAVMLRVPPTGNETLSTAVFP